MHQRLEPIEFSIEGRRTVEENRALIIDDDQGIRKMVEKLLQPDAFEVETAQDGVEGIRKIRNGEFSVILLDLMMPGLSGFAVVEFILADRPDIIDRVVVMTGRRVGETNRICNHDFTGRILRKPFKERDFRICVQRAVKSSRAS